MHPQNITTPEEWLPIAAFGIDPQVRAAYHRAYYLRNKEQIDANRRARELRNRQQITAKMRLWRQQHEDQARATVRRSRRRLRAEMLTAYGGRCACCGETEAAFLILDHINGGGKREKREHGGPAMVWIRLRREGWPTGKHQLLCANCNTVKQRAGHRSDSHTARGNRRVRAQMIQAYGGKCTCCGVVDPLFLELDHVNGGGTKDYGGRSSSLVYRRLRREGWPPGYQILCANCNMAKERPGGCPHQSLPLDNLSSRSV